MCISAVGRVARVDHLRAAVEVDGKTYTVDASLHPEVRPGDRILIQTGLILDVVSEEEAREIESFQREMAALLAADGVAPDEIGNPAETGRRPADTPTSSAPRARAP